MSETETQPFSSYSFPFSQSCQRVVEFLHRAKTSKSLSKCSAIILYSACWTSCRSITSGSISFIFLRRKAILLDCSKRWKSTPVKIDVRAKGIVTWIVRRMYPHGRKDVPAYYLQPLHGLTKNRQLHMSEKSKSRNCYC